VIAAVVVALALSQGTRSGDEGVFAIRIDTLDVARESFTLTPHPLPGGRPGWLLSATTRYDRTRPVVVLAPALQITADSQPLTLQFDVSDPRAPLRVLGQLGRNRFTVRVAARDLERAREFPLAAPAVVLDDSVVALYQVAAWFARPEASTLTAVVPRALRRESLTVVDRGDTAVAIGRQRLTLRRVEITGGPNERVLLWLDGGGRLQRLAIPSRRLVAERVPTD
jgi:hypothetical protein